MEKFEEELPEKVAEEILEYLKARREPTVVVSKVFRSYAYNVGDDDISWGFFKEDADLEAIISKLRRELPLLKVETWY